MSSVRPHSTKSYCENSENSIVLRGSQYSIVLQRLTVLFRSRSIKYCRISQYSVILRELRVLNRPARFSVLDRPLSFCLSSRWDSRTPEVLLIFRSFSESSTETSAETLQRQRRHRDFTCLQRLYRGSTEIRHRLYRNSADFTETGHRFH